MADPYSYPWLLAYKGISVERTAYGKPIASESLGSGGFGTVSRGLYKMEGSKDVDVAVKEPYNAAFIHECPMLKKAFIHEANTLSKINHTNIVRFYGAVLEENNEPIYAIVTEVLDKGLVKYLTDEENISDNEKYTIIISLANALEHLHSINVIHRNIKPSNIMMKGKAAKLIDFGLSREEEIVTNNYSTRYAGGTPEEEVWMSPEKRNGKQSTPVSDVYSFGMVMFYILTGEMPSLYMTDEEKKNKLKPYYGQDDNNFSSLVLECTDSDLEKRPSSATLSKQLREIGSHEKNGTYVYI